MRKREREKGKKAENILLVYISRRNTRVSKFANWKSN